MGARNVAAAFTIWGHLDHGPFRLLVGMAMVALDTPTKEGRPARVYFGGERGMLDLYGRGGKGVYNALSALRKAGAIEVMDSGRNGHRAVYKLNLNTFPGTPEGSREMTLQGDEPEGGRVTSDDPRGSREMTEGSREMTEGSRHVTPRKDKEVTRRSRTGDTSPPKVTHQGATTAGSNGDDLDYSTAYEIVQAAIGIEAAAARISQLAVNGTDYTTAMLTLAHQVEAEGRVRK